MRSSCPIVSRWGWRSRRSRLMPDFLRSITVSENTTLIACDSVVPSAAPAGPSPMAPMNMKSSAMFAAQATAMNIIGLFESPRPRKMALMMLYAVINGMPMKQIVR